MSFSLIHLVNSIEMAILSEWNQRNGMSFVIQKTYLKKKKNLNFGPNILNIFLNAMNYCLGYIFKIVFGKN